ncbi:MAG TPA: GntR family transcriptional regulator [Bryobacteraceae bacterium]|nr:GntR family transcriptional regulator [Bryobacteraceae bacterium]
MANELKSALNGGRRLRYQDIREQIRREIEERRYAPGERLPSDTELAGRFSVSRLTVIRALRELESQALVQRKAGSGTFVRVDSPVVAESSYVFGLLMPDLGDGEIFEPVARGIARAGESLHHRLLWGNDPAAAHDKEQQADELCRYLVAREVSGVFFSPVEHTSHQESVNQRIAEALTAAGIPIVLIDRCICRYPDRSPHDLIGIDNPRAGSRMTRHLIQAGCRRVVFASRPGAAPTVDARESGYREALHHARLEALPGLSLELENDQSRELRAFLAKVRPDGLVCANDFTAAKLMQALLRLGVRIPEDIKMVGINDVKYAGFLPVPLTTLRQPCQELGATAMAVMLDRLERPASPVRDVLLDCELIVRQSCGAK